MRKLLPYTAGVANAIIVLFALPAEGYPDERWRDNYGCEFTTDAHCKPGASDRVLIGHKHHWYPRQYFDNR